MAESFEKKENHFLRVFTGIAMVFIAFAHYYSRMEVDGVFINDVVYNVGRFVIPIFVMISGYFCFSKDGHSERNLKKKALHILLLIVFYKIFYLVFFGILALFNVTSMGETITFSYVIDTFLTVSPAYPFQGYGDTVWLMVTQPIWFIYSLFLIYGLWFVMYHFKIDFKWSWVLALPILVICLLFGEFLPMFHVSTLGSIDVQDFAGILYPFVTIPFFVIGYFLHKNKEFIDAKFSNRAVLLLLVGGLALMVGEAMLAPNTKIMYVGSLIVALSFFEGTFRLREDQLRSRFFEYIGRNMSAWMYVFFPATNFMTRFWMQRFSDSYVICEIVGPLLSLALDILMGFLMYQILKKVTSSKKQRKVEIRETVELSGE